MCGIVGYIGPKRAAPILVEGLKRLEYRGYDSSGIAVIEDKKLSVIKKVGKIAELRKAVPADMPGHYGIGHTRWATHGGVTDVNAHPHTDAKGKIAIVHNGIVENYIPLKTKLEAKGIVFKSETDSEVIAQLVGYYYEGDLLKAVKAALSQIKGTYGIACISVDEPGKIVAARCGSPLVLGLGDGEMFLASDVMAMVAHTKQVVYIEDGEVVLLTKDGFETTDRDDKIVNKKVDEVNWELKSIELEGFSHYMEKEIAEQSESILRAMSGRIDHEYATAKLGGLNLSAKELHSIERVRIVAAGTSYHAGLLGSYIIENVARIPASAELSSEIRYKNPVVEPNTLYFFVSQSGETADTLYAMRELRRKGAPVLGICNVVGSTIARESDGGVYVHSGPEIAVASTKAFTSQLTVFYLFALALARMHDMSIQSGLAFVKALEAVPAAVAQAQKTKKEVERIAKKYAKSRDFLFLGRNLMYPIALEGALKLKEISYIHAEGYGAGEIKHGPIALVNEETPSFFIVLDDFLRDKVISNMKEIKARKGPIIALATEGDTEIATIADDVIYVPRMENELMNPFVAVVPLQLFSYYCAVELERDVDQPRNLAKSVTVE